MLLKQNSQLGLLTYKCVRVLEACHRHFYLRTRFEVKKKKKKKKGGEKLIRLQRRNRAFTREFIAPYIVPGIGDLATFTLY